MIVKNKLIKSGYRLNENNIKELINRVLEESEDAFKVSILFRSLDGMQLLN
jgi:hypothetical protein